jgi:hypothetical protein
MKTKWLAAGLLIAVTGIVGAIFLNRQAAPPAASKQQPTVVLVAKAPPAPPAAPEVTPPSEPVKEPVVQSTPKAKEPSPNQAQNQTQKKPKEPLHDPDARDALALVGVDPEAEQYWLDAIYDTSLPDNEREDLMEDLNEVGFADPKNLTSDDLALIASRLRLIEDIAPYTDPFMAEHLKEAYKDLSIMATKAR